MSSGSYCPPSIKRVDIPKADGGIRPLGIPTVTDRMAQMTVKMQIEAELESHNIQTRKGSRPHKSAHQAVEQVRKRCWQRPWVLDRPTSKARRCDWPRLIVKSGGQTGSRKLATPVH